MFFDRMLAYAEEYGDFSVRLPVGDMHDNFKLTICELKVFLGRVGWGLSAPTDFLHKNEIAGLMLFMPGNDKPSKQDGLCLLPNNSAQLNVLAIL